MQEFPIALLPLLLLISSPACHATFTPSFRQFLKSYGGDGLDRELSREDLGVGGSFGGGNHAAGQRTRLNPVILVHGITNSAGQFAGIWQYFLTHGYGEEEVYATTYGDAGKTNVLFVTMSCHYVKVIRMMIQTVAAYTSNKVNVIGYSMGSPIARKAIMGGTCVDTNEALGPPLTGLVHTFLGVAGANWGSFLCVFPVGSCNPVNGMMCGSKFLNDINSRQRYEGELIFTIYSTADDKVGHMACGKVASSIAGENQTFPQSGMNHDQVIFNSAARQYNLVTYAQFNDP